jgi:hypothetical protein
MNFKELFKDWRSPYISRDQIYTVTGGVVTQKTLRNLDSMGEGIPGKTRVSFKKVMYPVESVIAWLEERARKYGGENING